MKFWRRRSSKRRRDLVSGRQSMSFGSVTGSGSLNEVLEKGFMRD